MLSLMLSSPQRTLLAGFVLIYVFAFLYLRQIAAVDPSSLFANPRRAYDTPYSTRRIAEADTFIGKAWEDTQGRTGSDPSICVGIATVQRDGARYFVRLVGSLLDRLSDRERNDVFLMPFIANVNPYVHQAFQEPWLRNVADKILTYEPVTDEVKAHLEELENPAGHFEKALFDYAYSLRGCMNTSAPYILMLEDDALAMKGWYRHTKRAIQELESQDEYSRSIYLRLFYNTGLQGWNSEFWPYYLFWSVVLELLVAGGIYFGRRRFAAVHRTFTTQTCFIALFICCPLSIALFFAAGRLTVHPNPTGIHRMDTHGCCSQALLFPREQVPALLKFFDERKIGFRDSLIEDYSDSRDLARWALTPSVFQHSGSRSSKWGGEGSDVTDGDGRTSTQNIFNFHFEQWGAEK